MVGSTQRIVTKSRYGTLRTVLLFLAFSIEYGVFFYESDFKGFVWMYLGYIGIMTITTFHGRSSKVYLKYESALTMLIGNIIGNFIVGVFLIGSKQGDVEQTSLRVLSLMICNLLTILLVLIIINVITKHRQTSYEHMVYILGKKAWKRYSLSEVANSQNAGMVLQASADLEQLFKAVQSYESVFLMDVSSERRNDIMKYCYEHGKTVYSTAKLSDILMRASGVAQKDDQPVFYCTYFGIGKMNDLIKRIGDIFLSFIGIVVCIPVFMVVMIAIKMEDGGPVFYKQIRCTKNLKQFTIYKFRSMKTDSEHESGARLSSVDDDRVTKVGRILRASKIDEIPQLINILRGDMSIVGPRPERPELIEENCKKVPEFVLRTKVKAGLTGYAQVRGDYHTTSLEKLKWDLMYIENYSLLLDVKIIIMTVLQLFHLFIYNVKIF